MIVRLTRDNGGRFGDHVTFKTRRISSGVTRVYIQVLTGDSYERSHRDFPDGVAAYRALHTWSDALISKAQFERRARRRH